MAKYIAYQKVLTFNTTERHEFQDITLDVENLVKESKIRTGSVTLQTHHTTCGLWLNENEPNLVGSRDKLGYSPDISEALDRFAHPHAGYNHDDIRDVNNPNGKRCTNLCPANPDGTISECRNGFSHAQALLVQSTLPLTIRNSELLLGQWQRILLVELDHARERKLTFTAQGEKPYCSLIGIKKYFSRLFS